jgi:hypothetical protein
VGLAAAGWEEILGGYGNDEDEDTWGADGPAVGKGQHQADL